MKIEELLEDNLPEFINLLRLRTTKDYSDFLHISISNFFIYILKGKGKIILARYQNKIIGGAVLGFEANETVYCLYYWERAEFNYLHPTIFTLYSAMQLAE